jgi:predicted TIM-barrel fold metal-dependent hydrolase
VSGLLCSMDAAGIDQSVICSIATKPEQFAPILKWSQSVASDRLIPFASIHPADKNIVEHVREVRDSGLKGLKIHPYYQDFDLAADTMNLFYEEVAAAGLIVIAHTGFDMAFPRDRRAAPEKTLSVITRFPELRFMATHLGGWQDWEAVERLLVGKPIMMDLALALEDLPVEVARRMILAHSPNHLLFGTDSPWGEPSRALQLVRALKLEEGLMKKILADNAVQMLG